MNQQSSFIENFLYLISWIFLGFGLYYYEQTYHSGNNFTVGLYLAAFTFLGFLLWLIFLGSKKKYYKVTFHVFLVSAFVMTSYWGVAALSFLIFLVPDGKW